MSFISNLFGGADNAANAQMQAQQHGYDQAQIWLGGANQNDANNINNALGYVNPNNAAGQKGVSSLLDLLGLNGANGSQAAMTNLATTPGYQFAKTQGEGAINAASAANGTLNSGKQLTDLSKFDSGLASQTYQGAVNNLSPLLGLANSSAGQASGLYSLGAELGNRNFGQLANIANSANQNMGNAQASADLADQSLGQSLLGGILNLGTSALSGGMSGIGSMFGGGASPNAWGGMNVTGTPAGMMGM